MTCRAITRSLRPGAYPSSVFSTRSPRPSRSASHVDSRSRYGAYCTSTLITWRPSGASEGSTSVGIVASRYGESETRPYFDASNARSRSSMLGAMTIRPSRRRRSPPADGNGGTASRARLTFATVPPIRRFPARHTRVGPSATGSTSDRSVRFGLALDATTEASISSPLSRATPETRWSWVVIAATGTAVRISAPKDRAAAARASASAPGPPMANADWPGAPRSFPTESDSITAVVPADHGPIAVYWIPRTASAARTASVSKLSPTKSATAMGRVRRSSRPAFGPRRRNARARPSPVRASMAEGARNAGGMAEWRWAMKLASTRTLRSKAG